MRETRCRVLPALVALVLWPAVAATQQGTIQGKVVDKATNAPVANVQLTVEGTKRGAITDAEGQYQIRSIEAGSYQIRAQRVGYAAETQSITLTAGGTVTADFAMTQRAVSLDAMVVTASGETQRARTSGVLTGKLEADSVNLTPVTNASELLQSRIPGVTVTSASGTAGATARIRIRGSNSLSLTNDPLVIVDGVRVNSDLNSTTIGVGGQVPSRLNDLNPEDIENIEVVKGPAAASLYGTAAANGVIIVTTKRGYSGAARWTLHAAGGTAKQETVFPANFFGFTVAAPADTSGCANYQMADGDCTQTGTLSWNPLMQASPFSNGNSQNYGLSVTGGTDRATYYISGNWDKQKGALDWNDFHHFDTRANLSAQPRDNMNITASVGYLQSRLRLPQNDNNVLGVLGGGLLGNATDDPAGRGYLLGQTPQEISAINTQQNVDRFTGSVNGSWQVAKWLNLVATTGLDFTNRVDQELVPPQSVFFADLPEGQRTSNPFQTFFYTMNGGGTATFNLLSDVRSTTSLGVQYNNETVRGTFAFGQLLLDGTGSLNGTNSLFSVGETNTENVTLGAYVQEQLAWRDRVFVNAALRADKNSAFGQNFKEIYYPSAGLSYVIGEEPWFPKSQYFSSLRLRLAYGETGQRPAFRDAIKFFNPVSVATDAGEEAGFEVGGVGNPNLKAERSKEIETGLDVGLFDERASLSFTYYNKHTQDALISVPLAPSNGQAENQWRNLGKIQNSGFEMLVNANVLNRDAVQWAVSLNGSTNKNKVVDLGEGITPIIFNGGDQEHVNGYSAGGYWQKPLTFNDANGDGLLSPDEVTVGDTAVFLGTPFPKREFSFNTNLTLFKYFRINGLLDYKGGQKLLNLTERFRCAFANCEGWNDPNASLASQAAAIGVNFYSTDAGYIEDASFWKLREVSLTVMAPRSMASRINASALSLTVAGRNLHTWTDYQGFDPELISAGGNNFSTEDFLTLPPLRYFTVRLDVTW
jgi:TonB-linked SusC/RagA family outer membrane protein